MLKIGLVGAGRTGGKVIELYGEENITVFDTSNPPSIETLKENDAIICFLPGPALIKNLDTLIESGVPVACGSTGFDWPKDIDDKLKEKKVAWIAATNFALGMNLVHAMIKILGKAPELFDDAKYKLHEVHHIHKVDNPSGTALSWEKWLGHKVDFSHEREGDNPGEHKLTLQTEFEEISIEHKSLDRKIFAQGAIWTAEKLAKNDLEPGLHQLAEVMQKELGL